MDIGKLYRPPLHLSVFSFIETIFMSTMVQYVIQSELQEIQLKSKLRRNNEQIFH